MKSLAIAALSIAIAACSAPRAPTGSASMPTPASPAPASTAAPPAGVASTAKRPAGQENLPLLAWRAFGNEPFWNVRVDGDTLAFTTPDDPSGRTFPGTHVLRPDGGVHYEGSDGGTAFSLDIAKGECSDGMSDNVYALSAEFRYGDMDYKGCAEAAK
jgi:uncharacterized membrane protein